MIKPFIGSFLTIVAFIGLYYSSLNNYGKRETFVIAQPNVRYEGPIMYETYKDGNKIWVRIFSNGNVLCELEVGEIK